MKNMPWLEAIRKVLDENTGPMKYTDIAQKILDSQYRSDVGATPAATVAANLSVSLKDQDSPFWRVGKGMYSLRPVASTSTHQTQPQTTEVDDEQREMGFINAFGMFWARDNVNWRLTTPKLLGVQQSGSRPVNFAAQAGVYVLYDDSRPIYVGRVEENRMGRRLREHTRDRLDGRWNRFSWFGVRRVTAEGELGLAPEQGMQTSDLIATMEALLIEGLEPPQNRRQGDGFSAVEFVQELDPDLQKNQMLRTIEQMMTNASPNS